MVININNSRKKLRLYIPPVTQLKTTISTLTLDQNIPEGEAEITAIYGNSIKDNDGNVQNFIATQLNTTQGVVKLPTTTYFPTTGMKSVGDYADEINQEKVIKRIYGPNYVNGSTVHTSYSYTTNNENAPFQTLYSKPSALSSVTYITEYPQCYPNTPRSEYCGTTYTKNTHWVINPEDSTSIVLTIGENSYVYTKGQNITWRTFGMSTEINTNRTPSKNMNYVDTNLTKFNLTDINYYYYHNTDNSINFNGGSNYQFHVRCDKYTTLTQIRNAFTNGDLWIHTVLANPVETEVTTDIKFPVKPGDTISVNDSTPLVADINFYKFKKDQVYKLNGIYFEYLKYLQADGNSWITLSNCPQYTRFIVHFQFMKNEVQQRIFNYGGYICIYINGSKYLACAQHGDWVSSGLTWANEYKVDMDLENKTTKIYNMKYNSLYKTLTHSNVTRNGNTIYLYVQDPNNRKSTAKLFSFQAYIGDTLSLDLVPIRVGQVGYMYDKVSGQLFGNSGTGNFILGPDKQ